MKYYPLCAPLHWVFFPIYFHQPFGPQAITDSQEKDSKQFQSNLLLLELISNSVFLSFSPASYTLVGHTSSVSVFLVFLHHVQSP